MSVDEGKAFKKISVYDKILCKLGMNSVSTT